MSEMRQAVATLAGYVAAETMDVPDAVRAAAPRYAAACQELNDRLATCTRLLQHGQRSEALRQAQFEPDLLTAYAELDFPGRVRWQEIAVNIGVASPLPLNANLARWLNQAFADEKKVLDLLRQHRLAALSRAPLVRRLDFLRLLAKAEPTNLGWQDDIRQYETARYDEIRAALTPGGPPVTWPVVSALLTELNSPAWTEPPPLDLVAAAQEISAKVKRKHGEKIIAEINAELTAAVKTGDLPKAEQLADEAGTVVTEYDIRGPSKTPLANALKWIEEERAARRGQRKFDQAVAQLNQALDDGVDWWYVQEYHRIVMEFHRPVPRVVAEKFAARARARTRFRLVVAVAVVGTILAAGGAYAIYALMG